jgi:hypothetical protein
MLFRPNGPEHEAHLLSARVAIHFSLPPAIVRATERWTLGTTRHHAASGCPARLVERRSTLVKPCLRRSSTMARRFRSGIWRRA